MKPLHHFLSGRDPDEPVFLDELGDVTRGRILSLAKRNLTGPGGFRDCTVAIDTRHGIALAVLLAILDGAVQSILLLPAELTVEEKHDFLAMAAVDVLFTDALSNSTPPGTSQILLNGIHRDIGRVLGPDAETSDDIAGPVRVHATRWIIPTSGTTGTPKLVSHTLGTLARSIKLSRGARMRWGLLYDLRRFAGLQVFLQSLVAGHQLIIPDRGQPLASQIEELASLECSALSATPTLWRKILMTPGNESLALEQITLGGEIVGRAILAALRRRFPAARITHIYASTEAGVGFSVHDGQEGFPAAYLDESVGGVKIAVDDDGQLLIRSATQDQHYLNPGARITGDDGWIHTGDLVRRAGSRCLFLGRSNGAINVGGNKVVPEEVEEVILRVPGISGCAVSGQRSSLTGMLVRAAVVPNDPDGDSAVLIRGVRERCQAELPPFKVPAIIQVLSQLELTAGGKTKRQVS
jgi:acyl-CoA synthetase (AMP-forming)/AMP-acid ligase II